MTVKELAAQSKQYFSNSLGEFIFFRTYSRWQPDKQRRETWIEAIQRYTDFMKENLGDKITSGELEDLYNSLLNQEIVPSMRLMWSAGEACRRTNVAAFNCSFIIPKTFQDFGEIMYISMCGTGVGFSVEEDAILDLPVVKSFHKPYIEVESNGKRVIKPNPEYSDYYIIQDSKEGWADALVFGLKTWYNGEDVTFDYSNIRPKGSRLKTMGGRASGPEPLKELLDFTRKVVFDAQGRRLTSIEVHDIICKIGEVVVAGGVRRSAMISLSDLDDEAMRQAKQGKFWETNPQRQMANNSAIYDHKPSREEFEQEWEALRQSGTGERGIFNRGMLGHQIPTRRYPVLNWLKGTNPCGEITLQSKQFCNLTSVVVRPEDTFDSIISKVTKATILGTYQASLTHFPYLSSEWVRNTKEEALLGVSFTGVWDNPDLFTEEMLEEYKAEAIRVNEVYAEQFGIQPSTSITCIKPSGNSSQLLNTASGLHTRHAPYYIRRIRISGEDPLFKMLKEQGVPYKPEVGYTEEDARTFVLEFPVKSPQGAITDLTAIEQLEVWKRFKQHFTEHNPSVTISVKQDEWDTVRDWVYNNWLYVGGLSFLPKDETVYELAPYEEITADEYERLASEFPEIDYAAILGWEQEDNTIGAKEFACVGGSCEII